MLKNYCVVLAVGAFIVNKKKILIVKKSPNEFIDAGLWTVPGGKIYPEENIVNGLKREVKEEVNLEITDYQWIGEDVFENNSFIYHAQHFLCKTLNKNVKLEKKLTEFHWLSKKELANFEFPINIKKRLKEIFTKYL